MWTSGWKNWLIRCYSSVTAYQMLKIYWIANHNSLQGTIMTRRSFFSFSSSWEHCSTSGLLIFKHAKVGIYGQNYPSEGNGLLWPYSRVTYWTVKAETESRWALTQGKQTTIGGRYSIPIFAGNEVWRENGKFFVSPIYGGVKLLLAAAALATPPGRPNLGSPPLSPTMCAVCERACQRTMTSREMSLHTGKNTLLPFRKKGFRVFKVMRRSISFNRHALTSVTSGKDWVLNYRTADKIGQPEERLTNNHSIVLQWNSDISPISFH